MPSDNSSYQPIPEGHRRLLVLAEFLETKVPRDKFNLGDWATSLDSNECGTAACAVGWATTIPAFADAGLRLCAHLRDSAGLAFGDHMGWHAVVAFFEVDRSRAMNLFRDVNYTTSDRQNPLYVAARIRAFVAEQAKVTA